MFTIKTVLKESSIHGLWVFANEFVATGDIIWRFSKEIDKIFSKEEFDKLSANERSYIYYNELEWWYVLCGDDAKYTNHSDDPNTKMLNPIETIAIKDIHIWDEITENYYNFDELALVKLM